MMAHRTERRGLPAWLAYATGIAVSLALVPVFWKEIDNDVYYIIAQGREILAAGDPGCGAPAYYGTLRGTVQNWLWCVLAALAERLPANIGPAAIVAAQAAALQALLHRMLSRHTKDPWASMAMSLLCILPTGSIYLYGLRPEAPSVILVLATMLCLERYRSSGKAAWLAGLPLCMLVEINLHAAMWPYHFAVMAAYLVPTPPWLESDAVRPDRNVAAAVAASVCALFANPYGADMPAYVFRALPVFRHVQVDEQGAMPITYPQGMLCMLLTVLFIQLCVTKRIKSSNAWTAGGLLALAWANYHSAIFIPVASYALAAALLDRFESKDPARIGTDAPGWAVPAVLAGIAACLLASSAALCRMLPGIYTAPYGHMLPAVEYVAAEQPLKGGTVVTNGIPGSVMEWYGISGVFVDTRCELMLSSINGEKDVWQEYKWFETGATERAVIDRYGDLDSYLLEKDVQFVVLNWADPKFPFLSGYMAASQDWGQAVLDDPDGICLYDVWIRKE